MKAAAAAIIADALMLASGGAIAVTAPPGMAQHLGLCAIGSCCGGAIGFAMSYRAMRADRLSTIEFGARSAANVIGGIPGGYFTTFLVEPYFATVPREALFMLTAMLCGVFLVGLFMLVSRLARSFSARLDGRTLYAWLFKILPVPPTSPRPPKKD